MNEVNTRESGLVGIVEINRPPHNFFDKDLISEIGDACDQFSTIGMRAIVLCATGKNFCAGADLSRPASDTVGEDDGADHLYRQGLRLFRCPLPIVAAVHGAAVGGGLGLALAADFRIASTESKLAANFNRLGFHPGFGLSVTLPHLVGAQQAALLFYTGRRIGGAEAHRIGLVDLLVPESSLRDQAIALATEIARSAPIAVQSTRRTLRSELVTRVEAAIDRELTEQTQHFKTVDFAEGVKAMAERRLPNFQNC